MKDNSTMALTKAYLDDGLKKGDVIETKLAPAFAPRLYRVSAVVDHNLFFIREPRHWPSVLVGVITSIALALAWAYLVRYYA